MAIALCRTINASKRLINTICFNILPFKSKVNFHCLISSKNNPILKYKYNFLSSERNFFEMFRKPTKEQLKIEDNIPDAYNLIYKSSMDGYVSYAQIIAAVSACILAIVVIIKENPNFTSDFSAWSTPPRTTDNEIIVYTCAFAIVFAILHIFVHRLPIRIYYCSAQKGYIFIFHSLIPFSKRKLYCKIGDVIHLPHTGILPWRQGQYMIKNQQYLLLFDESFRKPADLNIMLGIQRDDADETEN